MRKADKKFHDDIVKLRAKMSKKYEFELQMSLRRRIGEMDFAISTCSEPNRWIYAERRRNCFNSLIASQLAGVIEQRQEERMKRLSIMNSVSR